MLLARISDDVALIRWFLSVDGKKGRNRPASMLTVILGETKREESDAMVFESPEDFRGAWRKIAEN